MTTARRSVASAPTEGRQRVTAEDLLAAYPEEDPSTTGFAGRLTADELDKRAAAPAPPAADAEDDPTEAIPIGADEGLVEPWRTIGKIIGRYPDGVNRVSGTGVLVGPWHLLTASHVVTGDPPGTEYTFYPAYRNGERTGTGSEFSQARIVGFVGIHIDEVEAWDYMVCQLDRSLGWEWGWNGTKGSGNDGYYLNNLWTSAGYPGNLEDGKRLFRNTMSVYEVADRKHDSSLIKAWGDTAEGWSGGPLIRWNVSSGYQEVAGVLSGGESYFAGGPEMGRLVQWTRDNWYRWTDQVEDLTTSLGHTKARPGSGVAACSWEPGRIDLLWRGKDNHLRHTWYADGWGHETDLTVQIGLTPMASDPTVCSWAPGRLDILWRSTDGHLRHLWFASNASTTSSDQDWGWETDLTAKLGLTPAASGPAVTSWAEGRLDVLWRNPDNTLRHLWYGDGDWGWETDLTGKLGLTPAATAPTVTSWEPGRLDLLWRNPDNSLRHLWYGDGDWGWETDLSATHGYGPIASSPAICAWQPGRLDLLWRGSDTHLHHTWFQDEWGWPTDMSVMLGKPIDGSPAICSWESGRLDVFWVADSKIRHTAYSRSQ